MALIIIPNYRFYFLKIRFKAEKFIDIHVPLMRRKLAMFIFWLFSLNRVNHIVGKTTLYDMELDRSGKHILTACQDRSIRVYSVAGAKQTKSFKGSASEDGTLIKVRKENICWKEYRTGPLFTWKN